MNQGAVQAVKRAAKGMYKTLPTLAGVILLISMASVLIPGSVYSSVFGNHYLVDSVIGSAIGSILAGNPINSYVFGGEFLNQGVELIAVTAFLVAWVTVGVVQLPAEGLLLGKKFALIRNGLAFVFSIIVAVITVMILGVL